jgi:hypothetical protein
MQGLLDGIESMGPTIENWLSDLTNDITSWKGPPEKDRVLLNDAGASIIQGLIDGMESKYGAVGSSLGSLTKTIGGKFGQQFTADINAQVSASMSNVSAHGLNGGVMASPSAAAGVTVQAGAIQINNPVSEPASISLTKLLQNGSRFGMLQTPTGTPPLQGASR